MIVCFRQHLRVAGREYAAGDEGDVPSSLAATLVRRGAAEFVEHRRLRRPTRNRLRRPAHNRSAEAG